MHPVHGRVFKYAPIQTGSLSIATKKFAKIPNFQGSASRIVGISSFRSDLYVTTSVSGGFIYKITSSGRVSLWMNVNRALLQINRKLDFSNRIEGGIRSIAFHTNFMNNNLFYISVMERQESKKSYRYTLQRPRSNWAKFHSVVYQCKAFNKSKLPILNSCKQLIRIAFPAYNHVLKQIVFRAGALYIGHGDGASDEMTQKGGQSKTNGLGKVLKIIPLPNGRYRIPASNAFKNEIYALGFHNPHNLCFDKAGNLFIADTGRDNVEEINVIMKNAPKNRLNYGWPKREGHFNQLNSGGIVTGISQIKDAADTLNYPAAVIPHFGSRGRKFVGQSIAASCPIENGSPIAGTLLYANFPTDGQVYYSFLAVLKSRKTKGPLRSINWAKSFKANILYDHDNKAGTRPLRLKNLRAVIRRERGLRSEERVDLRFGKRQSDGTLFWSSKKSGWIYIITNSIPKKN